MTDEPFRRDVFRKHALGWIVQCPACGRRSKRMFRPTNPYPDPLVAARLYWDEHVATEEHRTNSTPP